MPDRIQKEKWNKLAGICVLAVYVICNAILLMLHEAWRDEVNVWLIARELSVTELFREIKDQGHPCLWYLLMMPFAKLGFPVETINLASCLTMAVAAGIFVIKAPIHIFVKTIMLFSPFFTYYYPVVARNYCLSALVMVLLAWCYEKRNEKILLYGLLLGLLVQTDIIALMPAGMISVMWLGENLWKSKREGSWKPFCKILKGLWIPLASLVLLIVQFAQISDSPVYKVDNYEKWELIQQLKLCGQRIAYGLTGKDGNVIWLWLFLFLALAAVLSLMLKNFWPMIVLAATYSFQVLFSAIVYSLHIFHFLFLGFVLVWFLWSVCVQMKETGKYQKWYCQTVMAGLQALTVILAVFTLLFWIRDPKGYNLDKALHMSQSDGKYTAEYVEQHLSSDQIFVSTNVARAATVIAYLPRDYQVYFAGNQQVETYADWSESQSGRISVQELIKWAAKEFPEKEAVYVLEAGNSSLTDVESLNAYEVMYQTKEKTIRGEEYTIYRVPIR